MADDTDGAAVASASTPVPPTADTPLTTAAPPAATVPLAAAATPVAATATTPVPVPVASADGAAAASPAADRGHKVLASGKRVQAEFATEHPPSPELSASLVSRIMHIWVIRLVLSGWRSPLTDADLWELTPPEQSLFTSSTFAAAWRSHSHEQKGRLPKTLWTIHRSFLLFTAFLKAGDVALGQVSPVFLNQLLDFLQSPDQSASTGYGWALALLVTPLIKTVFENAYFLKTMRMGVRVRSAIQSTLYRKSLSLSPSARAGKTVGEIVNYMQLDAQRISDFAQFIHVTWAAPIQVIVTVVLLYIYIGPSAFVGLAMAVVTIPLQSWLVKKQAALRKRGVGITDQRVKLINEVLQGIKAVKFYAWEKPFSAAIDEVRERELANYRASIIVRSSFLVIIMTVPTIIAVVTFAFYVGVFNEALNPSAVFTGIALLNQLRQPIMMLPFVVSALVDARVGAKRVEAFLDLDETDGYHRQHAEERPDNQSLARNTGDVLSPEVRTALHRNLRKAVAAAEAARRGRCSVTEAMDLIGELPSPIPKSLIDADGATGRGSITVIDGEFAWDPVTSTVADAAASSPLSLFKCLPGRRRRAAAAAAASPAAVGSPADVAVPVDDASPAAAGRPVPVSSDPRADDAVDGAVDPAATSLSRTRDGSVRTASVLQNVNLVCEPGKVTAVIGRVGSGKSSLVHALLGEMRKRRGTVALEGTCAYVAQNAWIFNGTLRDNILFGRAYDKELYQRAIHCSVLDTDLSVLPFGDRTAIGEKGINLSGGQKQRVSLARAIYADADVYLLDDPLSALDAHVGADVFERCLSPSSGILRNRTVVLVTNQLHFLPECHSVIMLADGSIQNSGEFRNLLHDDEDFRTLMEENTGARDEEGLSASHSRSVSRSRKRSRATTSNGGIAAPGRSAHSMSIETAPGPVRAAAAAAVAAKAKAAAESSTSGGVAATGSTASSSTESVNGSGTSGAAAGDKAPKDSLITLEERKIGNVRFGAYYEYARACGGLVIFFLILVLFAAATTTSVLNNWWLSYWSKEAAPGSTTDHSLGFYLGIYFGLAVAYAALTFVRSVWYLFSALLASRRLQQGAVRSVMHAPLSFFDTTPIGRILSRFSRDTDGVDVQLPQFFQQMLTTVFQLIASYVYIAVILPWFIAVAVPIGFGYFVLQRFFNRTSLELKRLDSISRSPIYAHFSETLGGLSTIRAYSREADFAKDNLNMVDTNVRAYFCYIAANRWFSLYLEIMGSMLVFATAILAVAGRGNVWAGDVGVALVYALQVTGILGFTVRSITELAGQMNSVERLAYYGSELPQEAPHEAGVDGKVEPPPGWPTAGAVSIDNLQLRYREGLELVLKGITLDIKGGERVGVVGRTGAGKSSMMIALLRLVEAAKGSIHVDGVDLASLGLSSVRRGVTIIPQDPVMFSGTLRFNIDPFSEFTEAELWAALEASHLKGFVENFEDGLDSRVAEYGDNLSSGQRQLVCLARALLRKPQLLLLDEASSSLDVTTDALLQTTIRTALRGCTIITIAHRLSTIADYDRVLVLSDGRVADFDAPSVLLARPASLLRQLVDALGKSGAAAFERLVALADETRAAGGSDADHVRRFVELAGAAAVQEGQAADGGDDGDDGDDAGQTPPLAPSTATV